MGFPGGTSGKVVKNTCQCSKHKRHGFHSWVRKIPWRRAWQPIGCLENPMDRGDWQATVHRVTKSWTQLKQFSTQLYIFVFKKNVELVILSYLAEVYIFKTNYSNAFPAVLNR